MNSLWLIMIDGLIIGDSDVTKLLAAESVAAIADSRARNVRSPGPSLFARSDTRFVIGWSDEWLRELSNCRRVPCPADFLGYDGLGKAYRSLPVDSTSSDFS